MLTPDEAMKIYLALRQNEARTLIPGITRDEAAELNNALDKLRQELLQTASRVENR